MTPLADHEVEAIARTIAAHLGGAPSPSEPTPASPLGVHPTVAAAVAAAAAAQPRFAALPLAVRARIVTAMRTAMVEAAQALARSAWEETGLGRVEDKVVKNRLVAEKTPGLEELAPTAVSGDHGLTLTEPAPFGVIGAITPSTNPTSTIICNAIGMLAAGNAVVFNVHPAARRCSAETVALLNRAIVAAGGTAHVVTCVGPSSIETAQELMAHPGIRLLVVTGGGGVVRAAMASGKRAVCAGPGNPPVVVDETADLEQAARDIVAGASCDNNIICVDEKEVLVVAAVADRLLAALQAAGAVLVPRGRLNELEKVIFARQHGPRRPAQVTGELVGRNASVILAKLGMTVPDSVRLALVEVPPEHPLLWTEQMMPVLPVCRVPTAGEAIELAVAVEGGHRHTAVMHSRHLDNLSHMARACDCSIFVKNARAQAGLGLDAEGYCSFTIASPTGEGLTGPRTFSRARRCVLKDRFRIT